MRAVLDALARHDARATFFFLGWVAERRPDLVRACLAAGHEVASHGYAHAFLDELGPAGPRGGPAQDERRSSPPAHRARSAFARRPFTLTRKTWWAFDVLVRRGYRYDSSIHPVCTRPTACPTSSPDQRVTADGGSIVEFPVATCRSSAQLAGGGRRLLPTPAGTGDRGAIAALERRGRPAALYLHPWEFDPGQPRARASAWKRFRHYLNLGRTLPRLERLLARFPFTSLREVLEERGELAASR
jgi:polysaccharide deacetylase family protein (PEP-CTERM system associated)